MNTQRFNQKLNHLDAQKDHFLRLFRAYERAAKSTDSDVSRHLSAEALMLQFAIEEIDAEIKAIECLIAASDPLNIIIQRLESCASRFETIRETHPDISLDEDIASTRKAIALAKGEG